MIFSLFIHTKLVYTVLFTVFSAEVTTSMIEAEDTVSAIRHLTENFGEQAEEYPLIISRPEFKKFKVCLQFAHSKWFFTRQIFRAKKIAAFV